MFMPEQQATVCPAWTPDRVILAGSASRVSSSRSPQES